MMNEEYRDLALFLSAKKGDGEMIQYLIDNTVFDNTESFEARDRAIRAAIKYGHVHILKLLLTTKGEIQMNMSRLIANYYTPSLGECIRLLLEDGREYPLERELQLINTSSKRGYFECLKLLLDDGRADPSTFNSSALYSAIIGNHKECVQLLLKDGRSQIPRSFVKKMKL